VLIEAGAGLGSGITDAQYVAAGASIAPSPGAIWSSSELVAKVKEPVGHERRRLSAGQVLFTYLHLAADPKLTSDLIASGATCIAYETVTAPHGGLPLLTPMSEVAGRLAPQVGAHCLERRQGGRGVLLGGVAGVPPADVLVLGGGTAGTHATTTALGMGASVTVVDRSAEALRRIVAQCGAGIRTIFSTRSAIEEIVKRADLVIGSVLVPGAATPKLLSRSMVKTMKPGAVIVDIAIDQGGCSETSRPTTHAEPTYVEDSVVHYCVANMPSAVARTSTFALNNVTLPFMLAIADKGWRRALAEDQHLRTGLSIHAGRLTSEAVAAAHDLPWTPPENALAI
jgi:alanine dehydrogenase